MITIEDVGEALVESLNASRFSQELSTSWDYLPTRKLTEMVTLQSYVVPSSLTMEEYTRGHSQDDFTLDVAVQKQAKNTQDRGRLSNLMHELARHCLKLNLLSGVLHTVKVEIPSVYDPNHLQEHDVFTSVMRVTLRAVQEI